MEELNLLSVLTQFTRVSLGNLFLNCNFLSLGTVLRFSGIFHISKLFFFSWAIWIMGQSQAMQLVCFEKLKFLLYTTYQREILNTCVGACSI